MPIIGSHGNSLFGYYPTFGNYPLTPIPPPHSTQIPPPAFNFQPSAPLPTTRAFAPLVPSAFPPTDPPALPHMDSFSLINATLPSFAVRQEQQDIWYVVVTNSGSNKSQGRGGKRAQGEKRSVSARAGTPSSDFHGSQRTSTFTLSRTYSSVDTSDPAIDKENEIEELESQEEQPKKKAHMQNMNKQEKVILIRECCKHADKYCPLNKTNSRKASLASMISLFKLLLRLAII